MLRYFLPADFLLTLGDFCTGRLPAVLRGAVRCAPVRFRDALAFLVFDGFFLVMRLRLTTFLVFFAIVLALVMRQFVVQQLRYHSTKDLSSVF